MNLGFKSVYISLSNRRDCTTTAAMRADAPQKTHSAGAKPNRFVLARYDFIVIA
jgi:hypothetical protein